MEGTRQTAPSSLPPCEDAAKRRRHETGRLPRPRFPSRQSSCRPCEPELDVPQLGLCLPGARPADPSGRWGPVYTATASDAKDARVGTALKASSCPTGLESRGPVSGHGPRPAESRHGPPHRVQNDAFPAGIGFAPEACVFRAGSAGRAARGPREGPLGRSVPTTIPAGPRAEPSGWTKARGGSDDPAAGAQGQPSSLQTPSKVVPKGRLPGATAGGHGRVRDARRRGARIQKEGGGGWPCVNLQAVGTGFGIS